MKSTKVSKILLEEIEENKYMILIAVALGYLKYIHYNFPLCVCPYPKLLLRPIVKTRREWTRMDIQPL